MTFISWINVIVFITLAIAAIAPMAILIIRYNLYRTEYQKKKYASACNTFPQFCETKLFSSAVSVVISVFATFFAVIFGVILFSQVFYWNANEDTEYNMMVARQETITELLSDSDAAVRESLYTQAMEFNRDLAKIQSIWKKDLYSITFSGDYNWDLIEPVKLK